MRSNNINKAVLILKQGGVVVYPTDTAYGLAVDATNFKAVKKLYRLKGRNFKKPIHVICPSKVWLNRLINNVAIAKLLIRKFWPGPLTIILPLKARGKSWQMLSAGTKTIGIRYPDNSTAQALVEALKRPITTTSANLADKPNCYSTAAVKKQFGKNIYLSIYFLDGGKLKKTKPSTVVVLSSGHVNILRQGPISERQIKQVLKRS